MPYKVKEIFYSIQGEGMHAGRPAVFCRFAGCNLWSGREEDRATAICKFCDTNFRGGDLYRTAEGLARAISAAGNFRDSTGLVILTGGEPALQVDEPLIEALHSFDLKVAIETNGTKALPQGLDWICVSPKSGTTLLVTSGDELKLVYPQRGIDPCEIWSNTAFDNYSLQPMDGPNQAENMKAALDYCLENPEWRLSLQLHKILEVR